MNTWEFLFGSAIGVTWERIAEQRRAVHWMLLGFPFALGVLNKRVRFGFAVPSLLAATFLWRGQAHVRRGVICAAAVLAVSLIPPLWWQSAHSWPTFEFIKNAQHINMPPKTPSKFWFEQVIVFGP